MPKRDGLHVLRQSCAGTADPEDVERQAGDVAQAGIVDLERPAVGKVQSQRDEGLAFKFAGQGFGVHIQNVAEKIVVTKRLNAVAVG